MCFLPLGPIRSSDMMITPHGIQKLTSFNFFFFQLQNPDDIIYSTEKANKAKFFLKIVNSKSAWFMMHYLMDVLTVLVEVSK